MLPQKSAFSPALFADPISTSSSSSLPPPLSSYTPIPTSHPSLVKPTHFEPSRQYNSAQLQQQHAYYPQPSFEDQQQLQQQRLVLQKQQQRAQLHLQSLQIRQKRKLLEDQQQSLQSLQSVASQNPILLPSSSSENFISTPHYNSLLSLPPESLTYPTYAHPFLNAATGNIDSNHNNHNNNNNTTTTTTSPNLISALGSTSSAMDILAM